MFCVLCDENKLFQTTIGILLKSPQNLFHKWKHFSICFNLMPECTHNQNYWEVFLCLWKRPDTWTNVFCLPADCAPLKWVSGVNFKRTGNKIESKANKCLQKYFIFKNSSKSLQIQGSNYEDFFVYKRQSFVCVQASFAIRVLYNIPFS